MENSNIRSILIIVALSVVLKISFSILGSYSSDSLSLEDREKSICTDIDLIRFVQKGQLKSARFDVFGSNQKIFEGEQYLFYDHSFGSVEVNTLKDDEAVSSLAYYRIWKNGNDNIRAHLEKFGQLCNASKSSSLPCSPVLSKDSPALKGLCVDHCYLDNSNLNGGFATLSKPRASIPRYAFTFVREPIRRFISGYSEIEYRMKQAVDNVYHLPLYAPVGSAERFKEFINMILKADGSKRVLHDKNSEIPHIAPQIGTLLGAAHREPGRLHLYRLEQFESEWNRLAQESGYSGLGSVYSPTELVAHPSSKDALKTTAAASKFLDVATNNSFRVESLEDQRQLRVSTKYLRALCRIYLVDYTCTGYALPEPCQDLHAELRQSIEQYHSRGFEEGGTVMPLWRRWTPSIVVMLFAELNCIMSSNPLCYHDIVSGVNSGIDIE